nr:MAG TPA: hypothetical protein [Caudoviricetes sp.]
MLIDSILNFLYKVLHKFYSFYSNLLHKHRYFPILLIIIFLTKVLIFFYICKITIKKTLITH